MLGHEHGALVPDVFPDTSGHEVGGVAEEQAGAGALPELWVCMLWVAVSWHGLITQTPIDLCVQARVDLSLVGCGCTWVYFWSVDCAFCHLLCKQW